MTVDAPPGAPPEAPAPPGPEGMAGGGGGTGGSGDAMSGGPGGGGSGTGGAGGAGGGGASGGGAGGGGGGGGGAGGGGGGGGPAAGESPAGAAGADAGADAAGGDAGGGSTEGQYTVAVLRVVEGEVPAPTELYFDFNPSEYTIAKSGAWTRPQMKGGKQTGKPEFQGANAQTLQMEILFDQYVSGDNVATSVNTLIEWVKPTDDSVKKKKPQPPIIVFEWGDNPALTSFRGYVKQVQAKYLMFDGSGKALRATANVTLEEVPIPPKKQNPTSGAIHGRRTHLVAMGDSLASIAWTEYEDPALWRGIAAFNGIDDPLRVRPGQSILIPTADEARRLA